MEFNKPVGYKNVSTGEMGTASKNVTNKLNEAIVSREEFQNLLNNRYIAWVI